MKKFRIWDKRKNLYHYDVKSVEKNDIDDEEIYSTKPGLFFLALNSLQNDDNYVIEQYTGVTDFSGREIYEGDTIKYNPNLFGMVDDEKIGSVEFVSGAFELDDYPLSNFYIKNIEIIGNIHETL